MTKKLWKAAAMALAMGAFGMAAPAKAQDYDEGDDRDYDPAYAQNYAFNTPTPDCAAIDWDTPPDAIPPECQATGGYCDDYGCPDDYYDLPVYYGPVFYNDIWFTGPLYYRDWFGQRQYWIRGGWRYDSWRGARPSWWNAGRYRTGPALGRQFYQSRGWNGRNSAFNRGWTNGNRNAWNNNRNWNGGSNWNNNSGRFNGGRNWSNNNPSGGAWNRGLRDSNPGQRFSTPGNNPYQAGAGNGWNGNPSFGNRSFGNRDGMSGGRSFGNRSFGDGGGGGRWMNRGGGNSFTAPQSPTPQAAPQGGFGGRSFGGGGGFSGRSFGGGDGARSFNGGGRSFGNSGGFSGRSFGGGDGARGFSGGGRSFGGGGGGGGRGFGGGGGGRGGDGGGRGR